MRRFVDLMNGSIRRGFEGSAVTNHDHSHDKVISEPPRNAITARAQQMSQETLTDVRRD